MNRNLGILVRGDASGLGSQTRRMTQLIRPERILYIDSTGFGKNKDQHPEWYDGFSGYKVKGFPTDREVDTFMKGLTHFICCENPHNMRFYAYAKMHKIKTYCVVNYEFLDNLKHPEWPEPDYFIMPSYWKVKEMQERYSEDRVIYLPPPLDLNDFKEAREINMARDSGKVKLLHIVGTLAAHDRNGTLDLLNCLKFTNADFSLTIKSQQPLPPEYLFEDYRISYKFGNEPENQDLYKDFDYMVLPRRYGGLCLPVCEALASGLPVLMPDISPNNELLPQYWLFNAKKTSEFMARVPVDVYSSDLDNLSSLLHSLAIRGDNKITAFALAHESFSNSALIERYNQLWQL